MTARPLVSKLRPFAAGLLCAFAVWGGSALADDSPQPKGEIGTAVMSLQLIDGSSVQVDPLCLKGDAS